MHLLRIEHLSKHFGGLNAVDDVTFSAEECKITGIIGPNGAGKTTLFNMLTGFVEPSRGAVFYDGEDITGLPPHMICNKGMCRTFQIVRTFPELTVKENIMIGTFLRYPKTMVASEKADHLMEKFGISQKGNQPAKHLTLQECKRLEMARALATDPKMLLLDEVMAGLTPSESEDVIELIRKLNREGYTFLIIEHVMRAIMALSDNVIVLNYGQKIAEGEPETVINDPEVIKAYLGDERGNA